MVRRAEATGFGVAAVGHVLLFGVLSLGLIAAPKPVPPLTPPIDIQIVDAVALTDTAPDASLVEPAPSVAPEVGPPVEVPPPESAPVSPPTPVTKPASAPPPKAAPSPAPAKVASPKPVKVAAPPPQAAAKSPAKATPTRQKLALDLSRPRTSPTGSRLGQDFLKGVGDRPSPSVAQTPRAATGPAVEASLAREVLRQLKPFWKAPSGADAEQLRTELSIALSRDGGLIDVRVIRTTGQTDSNRGQVRLHQEAAIKAVRLAAPFVLPTELYDAWKLLEPVGFDKRLG